MIPFNKPHLTGRELTYIKHAHTMGRLAGNGFYTQKTQKWMQDTFNVPLSLLTHSATAAIEMMAMLSRVKPGDEVIIPNYTFVSTANAFVLRGAVPVFVDIRNDTLNINERLIERAITKKTKAIVPVHYAGVGCEMDVIGKLAKQYKLLVLEDAAQGFLAKYKNKYLGTIGDLSAFSFHETKNIISGEGGALFVKNKKFSDRAKIIWEKGTNRSKFFLGLVDKYTWVDIGSSYLPGEITAAFLMAQLEKAREINNKRMTLWNRYHEELLELERKEWLRRPVVPTHVSHNAHLYYILIKNASQRLQLIEFLKKRGILAVTHYVPLHSSPGGRRFCRISGTMNESVRAASTLLRLPLFYDLKPQEQSRILQAIHDYYKRL